MKPSEYQPFDPQVHEYVDGRMSADAERDFVRKLERNPELKKQVESLQKALELLHTLPVQEPKPGFDERVIGRIREEELADRARKQIASAPVPMWQHIVQVGLGAAAAALVFAIIGVPGYFDSEPDPTDMISQGGGGELRVSATEEDLLPALADQRSRFESMRRSVACTRVDDPHEQRELIMLELEYADLQRRNSWLQGQVADLSPSSRAEYEGFIASMDEALALIQDEVSASLQESRAVDMAVIKSALAKVPALRGKVESVRLVNNSGEIVPPGNERIAVGNYDDVDLYALVRRAEYRHDHASVIDAARVYRDRMKTGTFKIHSSAAEVAAYLRLGQDREAATVFNQQFKADYDEDLSKEQMTILRGLMTDAEWSQLAKAREALRNE